MIVSAELASLKRVMSALGQSGHFAVQSSCPLCANSGHRGVSLDHLVGGDEQAWWDGQTERPGGLHIDDGLVLGRRLYRQIGRLGPAQDAIDIGRRRTELIRAVGAVAHEPTGRDEETVTVHGGQAGVGLQALIMRSR